MILMRSGNGGTPHFNIVHHGAGRLAPDRGDTMTGLQTIDLERMASEAFDLLSETGENPEYDRALFDLLARCFQQRDVFTDDRAMAFMLSMHCPRCDGPRASGRVFQCSECAPLFVGQTHD